MKVFVVSKEGKPLMPTTPRRARIWLAAKQARVVRREPFTIQLRFETTTYTQPATVGVDTGSKIVGIAALANGEAVFQAEVHLRNDIAQKMTQRRQYLRNRRARKTRYREKRLYETKYKRIQMLSLPKSHANDAVAIACQIGEVVKPGDAVHQIRCLPRGQYQHFNGQRSEHKCWAPRKVRGFKLYELVRAKGQVGYIGGRREKGAFVIKDVTSGKKLLEVTPRKLVRVARPSQGWMITRLSVKEVH